MSRRPNIEKITLEYDAHSIADDLAYKGFRFLQFLEVIQYPQINSNGSISLVAHSLNNHNDKVSDAGFFEDIRFSIESLQHDGKTKTLALLAKRLRKLANYAEEPIDAE